jgi:hypothetical protein
MMQKRSNIPDTWSALMAAASMTERPAVAAQCLGEYFSYLRGRGPNISITDVLCGEMLKNVSAVREVVLAIPKRHSVFALDGLEDEWGNDTATALKNYLDVTRAWNDLDEDAPRATLVRNMWLHPDISERLCALQTLADSPPMLKYVIGRDAALMNLAAWEVATDDNLSATSLAAATQIALHLYDNERSAENRTKYPVLDALCVVLTWCLRGADKFKDPESLKKAQALLVEYPSVCLQLLEFSEFTKATKFPYHHLVLHGPQITPDGDVSFEQDRFSSLMAWLPGQKSTITWAKSIDLPYRDTLKQLATAMATQESVALPFNLNTESMRT